MGNIFENFLGSCLQLEHGIFMPARKQGFDEFGKQYYLFGNGWIIKIEILCLITQRLLVFWRMINGKITFSWVLGRSSQSA